MSEVKQYFLSESGHDKYYIKTSCPECSRQIYVTCKEHVGTLKCRGCRDE